jgi:hypothetical protein
MRLLTIALLCLVVSSVTAQQKFTIRIEPSSITNAPGIHSGAFGEYDKKWFFIGGRKNGLHGFLPPSAFTETGVADTIYIVNPSTNQRWSADVYSLPDSIREAITSSNMQFYLNDSMLYMIGRLRIQRGYSRLYYLPHSYCCKHQEIDDRCNKRTAN